MLTPCTASFPYKSLKIVTSIASLHSLLPKQEPKNCNLYCITAQPPSHTRASQCNLYCITFSNDPRSTCFNKRAIATILRNQNTCSLIQTCKHATSVTPLASLNLCYRDTMQKPSPKVSQTRVRESKLPILNAT